MPGSNPEVNLLFGVLALQMDFISREQLVAAATAWLQDKSKSFRELLLHQKAIEADTADLLQALVEKHLARHGNDPDKSLAATHSLAEVSGDLEDLGDSELAALMSRLAGTPQQRFDATVSFEQRPGDLSSTSDWGSARSADQRFRILRPFAKGGLGQISVALDEQLQREVALKELQAGHADHPVCRSRFLLEAEITGSLEHPSIVPVYALGHYPDGKPYYAMRLIRGDTLRQAIEDFHRESQSDPGQRALELRRLLRHFLDVCNAVQYAHSRGVLHRDLKPSNVMLGKYGETLVMDWGLAKSVSRAEDPRYEEELTLHPVSGSSLTLTQTGSVVGTPAYMSPEQAAGRLDQIGPATDVYSLGATLYSLLTNMLPFHEKDRGQLLQKVQRGDFPRPRQVIPTIAPALEAICLKAMAVRPTDRYPSCRALAEDLEHWLADEPVSAYPERWTERALRWIRRHRSWAIAAVAALGVVAVTAVTATVLVNRARQQAITLAFHNRQLADAEQAARREALARFRESRQAVDTWLTGASEVLKYYPSVQEARKRLLEEAAADYRRFVATPNRDPALETERGRIHQRLGDVCRLLGQSAEAEKSYRAAIELLGNLDQRVLQDPECQLELANSRVKLGLLMADLGRHAEADRLYQSAIARLEELAKVRSTDPRLRHTLGTCLLNRGALLAATGNLGEAEQAAQEAIRQFEPLVKTRLSESEHLAGLSTTRILAGQIAVKDGRIEEGLGQIHQALATFDALVRADPKNAKYHASRASTRIYQASLLRNLGQYKGELDAYRQAVADYQALAKVLPDVPQFQEDLMLTRTDLANLLYELGQAPEAERELRQAMDVFRQLAADYPQVPRYHEELAACRDALGQVLSDLGRVEEAQATAEAAVTLYQELVKALPQVPQYQERLAVGRSHLARVLHQRGEHEAAKEAFLQAIQTLEALTRTAPGVPAYRDELAFIHEYLGNLLHDMAQPEEAAKSYRRARTLWQEVISQSPAPEYEHHLAKALACCPAPEHRNPQKAIELARHATDASPGNAIYWGTLGAAHCRAEDWQAAAKALRKSVELFPEGSAKESFYLAMAQWHLGDHEGSDKTYQEACRRMDESRPGNPDLIRMREEIGKLVNATAAASGK